jgi:competence protein ComEA
MNLLRRLLLGRRYVSGMTALAIALGGVIALEALASAGAWPLGGGRADHTILITGPGTGSGAPPITVEVLGAVRMPGVYRLPAGDRVRDVVASAGGLLADADPTRMDLAAPLVDGQVVYVPRVGEMVPVTVGGKIDINTASAEQMHDALGLSLALAQRIVAYRAAHGWFTAISQLLLVPISRATYDRIKDLITV